MAELLFAPSILRVSVVVVVKDDVTEHIHGDGDGEGHLVVNGDGEGHLVVNGPGKGEGHPVVNGDGKGVVDDGNGVTESGTELVEVIGSAMVATIAVLDTDVTDDDDSNAWVGGSVAAKII